MPKKTTYSRSSAQRNKPRQKAFELVRPASDENALEATAKSGEANGGKTALKVEEIEEKDYTGEEGEVEEREEEELEVSAKKPLKSAVQTKKAESEKKGAASVSTSKAALVKETASDEAPKSAAARLAARRDAAKKAQSSSSHAISPENYAYVRKDLLFILILAVVMFSAIIALHFIIGS